MDFTIIIVLASMFVLSNGVNVLPLPPPLDVCSDGQVSIPVCSFLTTFSSCTHSMGQAASDNISVMADIGQMENDGELFQLALLPRNIVSILSEHAFNTSSGIGRALGAITQHFNWNRLQCSKARHGT